MVMADRDTKMGLLVMGGAVEKNNATVYRGRVARNATAAVLASKFTEGDMV